MLQLAINQKKFIILISEIPNGQRLIILEVQICKSSRSRDYPIRAKNRDENILRKPSYLLCAKHSTCQKQCNDYTTKSNQTSQRYLQPIQFTYDISSIHIYLQHSQNWQSITTFY